MNFYYVSQFNHKLTNLYIHVFREIINVCLHGDNSKAMIIAFFPSPLLPLPDNAFQYFKNCNIGI